MSDTPKAYAINSAEGASVHVDDSSDDETFEIKVVTNDGAGVESHEGVTADTVGAIKSDYFTVEYIDPPAPEAVDGEDQGDA